MEGESVRVGQSCTTKNPNILDIHILVVDDDATSLAIVSAMLRTMRYGGIWLRSLMPYASFSLVFSCMFSDNQMLP